MFRHILKKAYLGV